MRKAYSIQANPLLTGANPLPEEIKNYLADKQEKGIYRAPVQSAESLEITKPTPRHALWLDRKAVVCEMHPGRAENTGLASARNRNCAAVVGKPRAARGNLPIQPAQHETLLGRLPLASRLAQQVLQQVRPWIEPAQSFEKNQLGLERRVLQQPAVHLGDGTAGGCNGLRSSTLAGVWR